MKLNWGQSIAVFYSIFVALMILMVVKSTQNRVHMVQENYYEKDLNYESFRQKRENGFTVDKNILVEYYKNNHSLAIKMPADINNIEGDLTLFRPSNQFMDKKYTLKLDNDGIMRIDLDRAIAKGKWTIQIDWNDGQQSFYNEKYLVL